MCVRNRSEKCHHLALGFCHNRRKGSGLKNLAGALRIDGGGCTLSAAGKSK